MHEQRTGTQRGHAHYVGARRAAQQREGPHQHQGPAGDTHTVRRLPVLLRPPEVQSHCRDSQEQKELVD